MKKFQSTRPTRGGTKKIRFDKKWKENVAGCQKNGIPFGAYYFPTAVTDAEALEGAKWFYEQIKDLSFKNFVEDCLERYDMPPDSIMSKRISGCC